MTDVIKVIFAGTPAFAVPYLQALLDDARYRVLAVITPPDKPVGRRQIITASPVKMLAQQHNLSVYQPERLTGEVIVPLAHTAQVFVVVAYGQILGQEVLDLCSGKVVNAHASLLPKYRGASPIQAVILNGDDMTGVTIMEVDSKMDHGPIIASARIPVASPTFEELHDELSRIGSKLLADVLAGYVRGEMPPMPQDHGQATYCKKITKESGRISWRFSAQQIERMIRAYDPWPGVFCLYHNKRLIIHKAKVVGLPKEYKNTPMGMVVLHENTSPAVICGGQSALILETIQLEGKSSLLSPIFLQGNPYLVGSMLL